MNRTYTAVSSGLFKRNKVFLGAPLNTQNFEKNPVFLYMHDDSKVIGRVTALRKDGYKLDIDVEFIENLDPAVKEAVEKDMLKAVSVGFVSKTVWSDEEDYKKYVELRNLSNPDNYNRCAIAPELVEISLVSVPADADALLKQTLAENREELETFRCSAYNFDTSETVSKPETIVTMDTTELTQLKAELTETKNTVELFKNTAKKLEADLVALKEAGTQTDKFEQQFSDSVRAVVTGKQANAVTGSWVPDFTGDSPDANSFFEKKLTEKIFRAVNAYGALYNFQVNFCDALEAKVPVFDGFLSVYSDSDITAVRNASAGNAFSSQVVNQKKLIVHVPISNGLVESTSNLTSIVFDVLKNSLIHGVDNFIFNGDGTPAYLGFTGIFNLPAAQADIIAGAAGTAFTLADIEGQLAKVESFSGNLKLFINHADYEKLRLLKASDGHYVFTNVTVSANEAVISRSQPQILGYPVVVSEVIPAGSFVWVDCDSVHVIPNSTVKLAADNSQFFDFDCRSFRATTNLAIAFNKKLVAAGFKYTA